MRPDGVAPHWKPTTVAWGSATIAAGRARIGLPAASMTGTRLTWTGVLGSSSTALVMSSVDRSQDPAFAVTSKQPVLSVAIAIGSSPMLIEFLPGVSLSASATKALPGTNVFAGPIGQCAIATVPGADWRMKPYQTGISTSFRPGGVGIGSACLCSRERVSQEIAGCAVLMMGAFGSRGLPSLSSIPLVTFIGP